MADDKKQGTLLNKDNIENYLKKDTEELKKYISENKETAEKIKNVKTEDANIAIRRNNAV